MKFFLVVAMCCAASGWACEKGEKRVLSLPLPVAGAVVCACMPDSPGRCDKLLRELGIADIFGDEQRERQKEREETIQERRRLQTLKKEQEKMRQMQSFVDGIDPKMRVPPILRCALAVSSSSPALHHLSMASSPVLPSLKVSHTFP